MKERASLDTLCAALAYAVGVEAPACAAPANKVLTEYVDSVFGGEKAQRVLLFNPDAVGQWIAEKYPAFIREVLDCAELELPLLSPMPSVTPVCFGTMYTGAQPEVHGIQSYTKPVIAIDTLFDALLRAGKKVAIVAQEKSSVAHIFRQRALDYYAFDTNEQVNAKAAQLILEDRYDFLVVYNGNYDMLMHRHGPESPIALGELRANSRTFGMFVDMVKEHWAGKRTLIGFCTDHGAHEIDGDLGSHGLDMPEDVEILHFFRARNGK